MELEVKLQVFEGPLDLLLHLLEKNKVSIYDIPIVEITNQYLVYIKRMDQTNLDLMSEFLVMAATLIDIKSKMLLPKTEEVTEEEDPRTELVQQLLEYKMYKLMSYALKEQQEEAQKLLFRDQSVPKEILVYEAPINLAELMKDIDLVKLNGIFKMVMRKQENKIDRVRASFGRIEKEEISLSERMEYIEAAIKKFKKIQFLQLLEQADSRMKTIVTFLAVLELIKTGKITIVQEELFDEIYMIERIVSEVTYG